MNYEDAFYLMFGLTAVNAALNLIQLTLMLLY
jgi:hypothetical protein